MKMPTLTMKIPVRSLPSVKQTVLLNKQGGPRVVQQAALFGLDLTATEPPSLVNQTRMKSMWIAALTLKLLLRSLPSVKRMVLLDEQEGPRVHAAIFGLDLTATEPPSLANEVVLFYRGQQRAGASSTPRLEYRDIAGDC